MSGIDLFKLVIRTGFEPAITRLKVWWLNHSPTGSGVLPLSCMPCTWWTGMESNHRRAGLQPAALPAELPVHLQKKAPVDLNQPGLSSGVSSGRFVVTRLPAGLCQEGLTHRFVIFLIKTEKSRAFDGIRHGAGTCQRGAGHGRFRITATCRYQGCVHSAAEYIYSHAIVKGLFFVRHPRRLGADSEPFT